MFKLYRSSHHPGAWIVDSPATGWVILPDSPDGWEKRRPARGLDPVHLRQVPNGLAAHVGIDLPAPTRRVPAGRRAA